LLQDRDDSKRGGRQPKQTTSNNKEKESAQSTCLLVRPSRLILKKLNSKLRVKKRINRFLFELFHQAATHSEHDAAGLMTSSLKCFT
jgi:hypothetical protein